MLKLTFNIKNRKEKQIYELWLSKNGVAVYLDQPPRTFFIKTILWMVSGINSINYRTGYGLDNGWWVTLVWYTHSQTDNLSPSLSHSYLMPFNLHTHSCLWRKPGRTYGNSGGQSPLMVGINHRVQFPKGKTGVWPLLPILHVFW